MPRWGKKSSSEQQLGFDLLTPTNPSPPPPPTPRRAAAIDLRASSPPKPAPAEPEVFSVREITARIRRALESTLGLVWVKGEISNYRRQASGHHYFTLKDESSQLSCVLFAGDARSLRGLELHDGLEIRARGEITVYEARGQVQMVVKLVEEIGQGALQARFAALKEKLAAAGLFAPERKRPLPPFPRRLGLITSPTGAALRDFLHVLQRRSPRTEVVLFPVRVQGRGAAAEMVEALAALNDYSQKQLPLDVLVLTRGGGSLEDLWEFNEEILAHAIAASSLPVVSAVGHEIDFTISDFVADLRAPTPSAAAEILSADTNALHETLATSARRLRRSALTHLENSRRELLRLRQHRAWQEPSRLLREHRFDLDQAAANLQTHITQGLTSRQQRLQHATALLRARHPLRHFAEFRRRLVTLHSRLRQLPARQLQTTQRRCQTLGQLLRAFDPHHTLQRGYTLVRSPDGKILTRAAQAAHLPEIQIVFADATLPAKPHPTDQLTTESDTARPPH